MHNEQNEIVKTDLSRFGSKEKAMLMELLAACETQGIPKDFDDSTMVAAMNISSGNVFLTNEDGQVVMMNGDKLESFYSCPNCGHKGFFDEFCHNIDDEQCQEYYEQLEDDR